jgi:hypothetical protein
MLFPGAWCEELYIGLRLERRGRDVEVTADHHVIARRERPIRLATAWICAG